MKFLKFIISLYLLSNVCPLRPLLTKYGTEILTDNYVFFESKDFDDNEEMHFKIQSKSYNFVYYSMSNEVECCYISNPNESISSTSYPQIVYFKKTTNEDGGYQTKYFTIRKIRSENTNENATNIERATITNTEEDEGKLLKTWAIVVIIVICVAIIAGIIIYCICRRIRMKKAQQQVYQNNNYASSPLGIVPDTGYNSKAAM